MFTRLFLKQIQIPKLTRGVRTRGFEDRISVSSAIDENFDEREMAKLTMEEMTTVVETIDHDTSSYSCHIYTHTQFDLV